MKTENFAFTRFVDNWIAEFSRAVEKFGGQPLEARHSNIDADSLASAGASLWVKQRFAGATAFAIWVGAPEASWTGLGASSGQGQGAALRSTYLEMLAQAQQGVAAALSAGAENALRCEEPETFESADFTAADFTLFGIELEGAGVPALTLAVELAGATLLEEYATEASKIVADTEANEENPYGSLDGLLNLKLPVSISLGQSKLALKKVLQAGQGTTIALNKETCEPVELLVQGHIVALGEIVAVKGNYAIRIQQVVDRAERLRMCTGA